MGLCDTFAVFLFASLSVAHHHPQHLMKVGNGIFAAGLSRRSRNRGVDEGRRLQSSALAFEGERLSYVGPGAYQMNVILSGMNITATLDTGSGICVLACKGER